MRNDKQNENLKTGSESVSGDNQDHLSEKKVKMVQAISLRFPVSLYKKLREYAFRSDEKINQIVVRLVEEYIRNKKI